MLSIYGKVITVKSRNRMSDNPSMCVVWAAPCVFSVSVIYRNMCACIWDKLFEIQKNMHKCNKHAPIWDTKAHSSIAYNDWCIQVWQDTGCTRMKKKVIPSLLQKVLKWAKKCCFSWGKSPRGGPKLFLPRQNSDRPDQILNKGDQNGSKYIGSNLSSSFWSTSWIFQKVMVSCVQESVQSMAHTTRTAHTSVLVAWIKFPSASSTEDESCIGSCNAAVQAKYHTWA